MPLTTLQRDRFSLQFLMFDTDSDGRITADELGPLLRCWGFCPTAEEVHVARQMLDPDDTGIIQKEQAIEAAESMLEQMITEGEVREALRILDADGDGYVSTAELRHILVNIGVKLTNEDADEIIADVFVDEDHHISVEDLVRLLFTDMYSTSQ